jgi:DNA topoisomerase-1
MASACSTPAVDIGAWSPSTQSLNLSISPSLPPYLFRANGSVIKFRGFLAVYTESKDEPADDDDERNRELPPLVENDPLDLLGIYPEQHFTQPPPRYTEATLIKALEEHGIGRPRPMRRSSRPFKRAAMSSECLTDDSNQRIWDF